MILKYKQASERRRRFKRVLFATMVAISVFALYLMALPPRIGAENKSTNAPQAKKRNILVIWGDDIGMWNVGAYSLGMMGKTPNIDRIGKEGMLFTDHYGQPSCTAGRAAFIMGQMPIRTGMTTIGIPGSTRGIQKTDPTLAEVLKTQGYATAQFGKNHQGDCNEFLPTVHGFDEWYGNLYHLNAEEEPEELDYPGQLNPKLRTAAESAKFTQMFAPRGMLHAWATNVDDPTTDPKFGRVGKQKIEDIGKLTRKRMETVDNEVTAETMKYLDKVGKSGKPFFVWYNSTAIHIRSRPSQKYLQMAVDEGRPEEDVVRARMIEHDELIGSLLNKLDELGIVDNTIVIYSTDNGNELMLWPDGGYAPFRGEKGGTWEGGVRVPMMVKWPGHIKPGSISDGIQNHEDVYVTLAASMLEERAATTSGTPLTKTVPNENQNGNKKLALVADEAVAEKEKSKEKGPERAPRTTANKTRQDKPAAAAGGDDSVELAKKLSNPVASLISFPLQSNFDFGMGTGSGWRYTLNVQPVIPIALSPKWNLISRTIIPIIHQGNVTGPNTSQSGLGDTVQSLFFSPNKSEPFIWAVGPVFLIPTATYASLGAQKWGVGPTALALKQKEGWTYGLLANHIWSVAGRSSRAEVNATFIQPFISYSTKDAWTYSLNTESTYDWNSHSWSTPINFNISKLVRFGKQPISLGAGPKCWVTSPAGASEGCGLRIIVTALFPKK